MFQKYSLRFIHIIKPHCYFLIIILAFIFLLYFSILDNKLISDENTILVPQMSYQNTFSSFRFSPLAPYIFVSSYLIFGLSPLPLRIVSIFLHCAVSCLVYFLFFQLFKKKQISFFSALLFAIHPLATESVTWFAGTQYVLYTMFFLLSFLCYLRSRVFTHMKTNYYFWFSVVFYILAQLASEKAVVLVLVFLLYELIFGKIRERYRELVIFACISFCWTAIHLTAIGVRSKSLQTDLFIGGGFQNPLTQIPYAITFYVQQFLLPINLSLYQGYSMAYLDYGIRLVIFLCLVIGLYFLYIKSKNYFFLGMLIFITLIPTLTPLKISSTVAERYIYIGMIGFSGISSLFYYYVLQNKKIREIGIIIGIVVIIFLSIRTIIRNNDWNDEYSFWSNTVSTVPYNSQVRINFGGILFKQGKLQEAEEQFITSIKLDPNNPEAYQNLGYLYLVTGNIDRSINYYSTCINIYPNNWKPYNDLAVVYITKKDFKTALEYVQKGLKISPHSDSLYSVLGLIYLDTNDKKSAQESFEKALYLNPHNERAKIWLTKIGKN
ncbi:MAG: tetratricopeptide repeat protein [Candidatus Roizmanbacteria bacterium]